MLIKTNSTSADNTLAYPIPHSSFSASSTSSQPKKVDFSQDKAKTTPVAGGGGILKSNVTSSENPLVFSNYTNEYNNNNNYDNTNNYNSNTNNTNSSTQQLQPQYDVNNNNTNNSDYSDYTPNKQNNFLPVESYRKREFSPDGGGGGGGGGNVGNSNSAAFQSLPPPLTGFFSAPSTEIGSYKSFNGTQEPLSLNEYYPKTAMPYTSNTSNNTEKVDEPPKRDIRTDVDIYNKQAYRRALDQQVAEKEIQKYNREKDKIRSERDLIKQYPFGRRTDPASMIINNNNNTNNNDYNNPSQQQPYYPSAYEPSFMRNQMDYTMQGPPRPLNKDNIVEKPNSLSSDIPPYDPIKHRSGFHQGFNYDPWGKPGGGAPLIDPNTGRKFTKYSGQVWYDTIGLSPDDRAKAYADRNRPLKLEDQRHDMEVEKQRRQYEESVYKSRAGDVATWITEIENQRKKHNLYGAHLPHTNVTRDKINLEYARRNINLQARNYHDELGLQQEERHRTTKLIKLKDDVAGIEHTRKWDDWWGKPGGGAPNATNRRQDIIGALESPRGGDLFNPQTSLPIGSAGSMNDGDGGTLYTKGNFQSSHRNLYDNLQKMKL